MMLGLGPLLPGLAAHCLIPAGRGGCRQKVRWALLLRQVIGDRGPRLVEDALEAMERCKRDLRMWVPCVRESVCVVSVLCFVYV
jgi:hypothetical protein